MVPNKDINVFIIFGKNIKPIKSSSLDIRQEKVASNKSFVYFGELIL